jgi:hypothetical protein
MTTEEWFTKCNVALAKLLEQNLDFDSDSIANYRLELRQLDHAVFQGFHLLNDKWNREFRPVKIPPKQPTIDDL